MSVNPLPDTAWVKVFYEDYFCQDGLSIHPSCRTTYPVWLCSQTGDWSLAPPTRNTGKDPGWDASALRNANPSELHVFRLQKTTRVT